MRCVHRDFKLFLCSKREDLDSTRKKKQGDRSNSLASSRWVKDVLVLELLITQQTGLLEVATSRDPHSSSWEALAEVLRKSCTLRTAVHPFFFTSIVFRIDGYGQVVTGGPPLAQATMAFRQKGQCRFELSFAMFSGFGFRVLYEPLRF